MIHLVWTCIYPKNGAQVDQLGVSSLGSAFITRYTGQAGRQALVEQFFLVEGRLVLCLVLIVRHVNTYNMSVVKDEDATGRLYDVWNFPSIFMPGQVEGRKGIGNGGSLMRDAIEGGCTYRH